MDASRACWSHSYPQVEWLGKMCARRAHILVLPPIPERLLTQWGMCISVANWPADVCVCGTCLPSLIGRHWVGIQLQRSAYRALATVFVYCMTVLVVVDGCVAMCATLLLGQVLFRSRSMSDDVG